LGRFENAIEKVKENTDKLGGLLGILGTGGGIGGHIDSVKEALHGNIHMPDVSLIVDDVVSSPTIRSLAMASAGLYIADLLDVPVLGKLATPVVNLTVGYAGGVVVGSSLYRSTHANEGSYVRGDIGRDRYRNGNQATRGYRQPFSMVSASGLRGN
jgi:hypothetical protein